jgi:site-specific DNA-methyltransferase (adenine-specific)
MWTWQDVNEYYLDKLIEKYPTLVNFIKSIQESHGKPMMAYITYMTQRLLEMYRILKPTGSLYLHCDSTASHYLKIVLDNIFGKDNFRNEIIWQRMRGAKGSQYKAKKFGASSDTILFYSKSEKSYFDISKALEEMPEDEKALKFPLLDENGRRYFDDSSHIWRAPSAGDRPNLCYEWRGFRNPHLSGWRLGKERLEEEYQKGNIVIKENGKLQRRKYEEDYAPTMNNIWDDIPIVRGKEATGYPTQKPLALMHRIINTSSKEGDLVLDPFCGCATTCVAAQQLNRKWIGIDIEKQASKLLVERLSDDAGLFKNFIHRVDVPQRTDIKIEIITNEK